tara:strand:- start:1123 stop:1554 length:432 start_codon:yes stop_codon:yes gene_type:complete
MSYLIQDSKDGKAKVLLSGGTAACEIEGAKQHASGKSDLIVLCDRKGVVAQFSGNYQINLKRREASKARQAKSQDERNAESALRAAEANEATANAALEKAKASANEAAKIAQERASAAKSAGVQATNQPTKKAAKKKAASNNQ